MRIDLRRTERALGLWAFLSIIGVALNSGMPSIAGWWIAVKNFYSMLEKKSSKRLFLAGTILFAIRLLIAVADDLESLDLSEHPFGWLGFIGLLLQAAAVILDDSDDDGDRRRRRGRDRLRLRWRPNLRPQSMPG